MSESSEGRGRRERGRRHRGQNTRNAPSPRKDERKSEAKDTRVVGRERIPPENRVKIPEFTPPPRLPTPTCAKCGEPIQDVTTALNDKGSGAPVHFDCVLTFLQGAENLGPNEKIVYIGQGRFAVMFFENPVDTRKFKILRTIEWEGKDSRPEWRAEISGNYSQVR